MNMRAWLLKLVALHLFFCAPAAFALRCGTNVIDEGMRRVEVEQKCGAPASKDSHIEYRTVRKRRSVNTEYSDLYDLRNRRGRDSLEEVETIEVVVEEWVYNFGSTRFMQLLIFEDGRLRQIKDLSYGQ